MTLWGKILAFVAQRRGSILRLFRFLVSGGLAALTELLLLYTFTQFFGIWYLFSSTLAFAVSFWVSFLLQKFWTFEDKGTRRMRRQLSSYLFVALANLAINAIALYLMVQFLGLWYMLAQAIIIATIAISNFLIYKFVIFKKHEEAAGQTF